MAVKTSLPPEEITALHKDLRKIFHAKEKNLTKQESLLVYIYTVGLVKGNVYTRIMYPFNWRTRNLKSSNLQFEDSFFCDSVKANKELGELCWLFRAFLMTDVRNSNEIISIQKGNESEGDGMALAWLVPGVHVGCSKS